MIGCTPLLAGLAWLLLTERLAWFCWQLVHPGVPLRGRQRARHTAAVLLIAAMLMLGVQALVPGLGPGR